MKIIKKVAKSMHTQVGNEFVTSLLANEKENKCCKMKSLGQNMSTEYFTSVPCGYISNHKITYCILYKF